MGFPSLFAACFILLACISQMQASVVKIKGNRKLEEYHLHITERRTTFTEKIKIDEEKGLEYFHVPAHNRVTEDVDYLYDFKRNVAIRRVESKATCYLEPLPDNLPKPAVLKKELQMLSQDRPFQNKVVVRKYWVVAEQVEKSLLSEEVQEFCGQFPVYRLQEVYLNSTNTGEINGERTRFGRQTPVLIPEKFLNGLAFCTKQQSAPCHPTKYVFNIKVLEKNTCTYWWLSCKFTEGAYSLTPCDKWMHKYDSMVCYNIACP